MVDEAPDVRQSLLALLTVVFARLSPQEVAPLLNLYMNYCSAAMSHRSQSVVSDSLQFFLLFIDHVRSESFWGSSSSLLPTLLQALKSRTGLKVMLKEAKPSPRGHRAGGSKGSSHLATSTHILIRCWRSYAEKCFPAMLAEFSEDLSIQAVDMKTGPPKAYKPAVAVRESSPALDMIFSQSEHVQTLQHLRLQASTLLITKPGAGERDETASSSSETSVKLAALETAAMEMFNCWSECISTSAPSLVRTNAKRKVEWQIMSDILAFFALVCRLPHDVTFFLTFADSIDKFVLSLFPFRAQGNLPEKGSSHDRVSQNHPHTLAAGLNTLICQIFTQILALLHKNKRSLKAYNKIMQAKSSVIEYICTQFSSLGCSVPNISAGSETEELKYISLLDILPALLLQLNWEDQKTLITAMSTLYQSSDVLSSEKESCLHLIGLLFISHSVWWRESISVRWFYSFPKVLYDLGSEKPALSLHVIRLLSAAIRYSSDSASHSSHNKNRSFRMDQVRATLTPFYSPSGPFSVLPVDIQRESLDLLQHLSAFSETLLASLVHCARSHTIHVSTRLQIIELLVMSGAKLESEHFLSSILSICLSPKMVNEDKENAIVTFHQHMTFARVFEKCCWALKTFHA